MNTKQACWVAADAFFHSFSTAVCSCPFFCCRWTIHGFLSHLYGSLRKVLLARGNGLNCEERRRWSGCNSVCHQHVHELTWVTVVVTGR